MFVEVILRSIFIFFARIIKKRYIKIEMESLFWHFIHYFLSRDMYDIYGEESIIFNK